MTAPILNADPTRPAAPLPAGGLDALAAVAHRAADQAGPATLAHFRAPALESENKDLFGGFDPVTAADRAAETAIRDLLVAERPEDAVLGEEEAARPGASGLVWVVDPVDGTRAFLIGAPTWGTLIGLDDGRRARFGIMDQPWTGERFWGDGETAWTRRRGEAAQRLSVRRGATLADARLCTTFPEIGTPEEAAAFGRVRDAVRLTRYGLDCTAYALLAAGGVDLVIEAGLQPYDIHALIPIVEGAGGVVATWEADGDPRQGGRIVAAASPELLAAARELLAG